MSSTTSHLIGVQLDVTTLFSLGFNTLYFKESKIDIPTDFWSNGKDISAI